MYRPQPCSVAGHRRTTIPSTWTGLPLEATRMTSRPSRTCRYFASRMTFWSQMLRRDRVNAPRSRPAWRTLTSPKRRQARKTRRRPRPRTVRRTSRAPRRSASQSVPVCATAHDLSPCRQNPQGAIVDRRGGAASPAPPPQVAELVARSHREAVRAACAHPVRPRSRSVRCRHNDHGPWSSQRRADLTRKSKSRRRSGRRQRSSGRTRILHKDGDPYARNPRHRGTVVVGVVEDVGSTVPQIANGPHRPMRPGPPTARSRGEARRPGPQASSPRRQRRGGRRPRRGGAQPPQHVGVPPDRHGDVARGGQLHRGSCPEDDRGLVRPPPRLIGCVRTTCRSAIQAAVNRPSGSMTRSRASQHAESLRDRCGLRGDCLHRNLPAVLRAPTCGRHHPHKWRRTDATRLLRHGVDVHIIQRLLAHARITTTAVYLHLVDDDLQDALDSVFPS